MCIRDSFFLLESLLQVWFIHGWLYLPDKVFEGISWRVELNTSFNKFYCSLNVHKFGWWFEQKSSTFNCSDTLRFGISALFHRWMVLGSGFCRVGWHNTSTTGILVWSLIPGTSIMLDVSVLLVVKRISRVLSFLVGKFINWSRLPSYRKLRNDSFNSLLYWWLDIILLSQFISGRFISPPIQILFLENFLWIELMSLTRSFRYSLFRSR